MGFNRTGQKRACPVCRGDRRDCRETTDTPALYFCRTDNPSLDFEFKKFDVHGFGVYLEKAILDAQDKEQREEWKRQRQAETEARLKAEKERHARSLSEVERDIEIRKLLNQLPLLPHHRQDLKRRELTDEQIDQGMFRSVEQWQKLTEPVSHRLAGVNINGRSLITQAGYICPIWNENSLIIGWQLRVDNADDGGKYKWPTGKTKKRPDGPTAHLQNGELPLTIHIADGDRNVRLAEGILKPYVAHTRRYQTYIGAAGGNFAGSLGQLKQYLDFLKPEKIILTPDAGSRANPHVLRQYKKIAQLLKSWGLFLWVEDWGQSDNKDGNCDVDEIRTEIKTTIIPFGEWDVEGAEEESPQQRTKTLTKQQWQESNTPEAKKQEQEWLSRELGIIADKQKNYNTCSLPIDLDLDHTKIPDFVWQKIRYFTNTIICLDSFKGSGKTQHFLKPLIQYLASKGKKILFITPRRLLGVALMKSLSGCFQDDAPESNKGLDEKKINIVCCCWDSLDKFAHLDWDFIGVDECRLGFKHLAEAYTEIRKKRPKILKVFSDLCKKVTKKGGNIFLADADFSDTDADYIAQLSTNSKLYYIKNKAKPRPKKVELCLGSKKGKDALKIAINERACLLNKQLSEAIEKVKLENPTMPLHSKDFKKLVWDELSKLGDQLKAFGLTADSQSELEKNYESLLDKYPCLRDYAIRIDRDTSEEKASIDFVSDIDNYIVENCILIWAWSPSLQVGISQVDPRFKEGFFIYTGTLEPCEFRQQILRSRTCEYWYGWAADKDKRADHLLEDWAAEDVQKRYLTKHSDSLQEKNFYQLFSALNESEANNMSEFGLEEEFEAFFKKIKPSNDKNAYLENPHIMLLAKIKARSNYGRYNCGALFRAELQDKENFEILNPSFMNLNDGDGVLDQIDAKKEEIDIRNASQMQAGAELLEEEIESVQHNKTAENQRKIAGFNIAKSLPGFNTSTEFFRETAIKPGNWRQNRFTCFLAQHIELAEKLETQELANHVLAWFSAQTFFSGDVKYTLKTVKLLHEIGLFKDNRLVLLNVPYNSESDDVKTIHKKALKSKLKKAIKTYFRTTVDKDNPINFVHKILGRLGYETRQCGRGEIRSYQILTLQNFDTFYPTKIDASPEYLASRQKMKRQLIWAEAMEQSWLQRYWGHIESKPIYGECVSLEDKDRCSNIETENTLPRSADDISNVYSSRGRPKIYTEQSFDGLAMCKKNEETNEQKNSPVPLNNATDELLEPEAPQLALGDLIDFHVKGQLRKLAKISKISGDVLEVIWREWNNPIRYEVPVHSITKLWRQFEDGIKPLWELVDVAAVAEPEAVMDF